MVAGNTATGDDGDGSGDAVENGRREGEGSRAWYFGFISSFIENERRQRAERSRKDGERGTLNYNPLRDTAEFAFKIKRT